MKHFKLLITSLFIIGACVACSSCKTDTGDVNKDRAGRVTNAVLQQAGSFVEKVALSTLANSVSGLSTGQKVDFAHAASLGVQTNLTTIVDSAGIQKIVDAWSGNTLPTIAAAAAEAFDHASPATSADKQAVSEAIAVGISNAALKTSK